MYYYRDEYRRGNLHCDFCRRGRRRRRCCDTVGKIGEQP